MRHPCGSGQLKPARFWKEANLPSALYDAVVSSGYTSPTPIQMMALPLGLANRDTIGVARTGSGKTAGTRSRAPVRLACRAVLARSFCGGCPLSPARILARVRVYAPRAHAHVSSRAPHACTRTHARARGAHARGLRLHRAAYLLPTLAYVDKQPRLTRESAQDGPYALVLAPTRELVQQIEEEVRAGGCAGGGGGGARPAD
jgi:hypothetical protein